MLRSACDHDCDRTAEHGARHNRIIRALVVNAIVTIVKLLKMHDGRLLANAYKTSQKQLTKASGPMLYIHTKKSQIDVAKKPLPSRPPSFSSRGAADLCMVDLCFVCFSPLFRLHFHPAGFLVMIHHSQRPRRTQTFLSMAPTQSHDRQPPSPRQPCNHQNQQLY